MVESESPLRLLNKTIPKISGPYSRQLRLNHEDTVALPPITSDESRGNRTALSNLTVKENMRVQFLLQLLGFTTFRFESNLMQTNLKPKNI